MALNYRRKALLVGVTGCGKSSLGNSLIGRDVFRVGRGFNAGTEQCQREQNDELIVIDTPGLFDTQHFIAETSLNVRSGFTLCPNPHAFLVVFNGENRFTQEDLRTIEILRVILNEVCFSHAICVFTRVEDAISDTEFRRSCDENESVRNVIQLCGGRVARIDNRSNERYIRARQIIRLIDNLSNNGNRTFDSSRYPFIETVLRDQQARNEQLRHRNPNYQPSQVGIIYRELHDISNALVERYKHSNKEGSILHWAQIVLGVICVAVGAVFGVYLIITGNVQMGFGVIVSGVRAATMFPFVRTKIEEMLTSLGSRASLLRVAVRL